MLCWPKPSSFCSKEESGCPGLNASFAMYPLGDLGQLTSSHYKSISLFVLQYSVGIHEFINKKHLEKYMAHAMLSVC